MGEWGDGGPRSTSFEATASKLGPKTIFLNSTGAASIRIGRAIEKKLRTELIIGGWGAAAPDGRVRRVLKLRLQNSGRNPYC